MRKLISPLRAIAGGLTFLVLVSGCTQPNEDTKSMSGTMAPAERVESPWSWSSAPSAPAPIDSPAVTEGVPGSASSPNSVVDADMRLLKEGDRRNAGE
jgi:hypothetical protein